MPLTLNSEPGTRNRRKGMTLVEVMMAFAILITGLVGIFALLNAGFRSHRRAINETEASVLASSMLAELRADFARGHVTRSEATGTFKESADSPGYKYNRQIIALDPPKAGVPPELTGKEYFVRLEIRWMEKGDNKSVVFDTVMFCNKKK